MLKRDELTDPNSCLNKAKDDEPVFTLLARDETAPGTILDWIGRRVSTGKNSISDEQIQDAFRTATVMDTYRKSLNK